MRLNGGFILKCKQVEAEFGGYVQEQSEQAVIYRFGMVFAALSRVRKR
jgi:hypothetical protein